MKYIFTPNAPTPAGHYSQATVKNGFVFVSGQLAIDLDTGEKLIGTAREQTVQCFKNADAILEAAGSGLSSVVSVTIYISDVSLWGEVNDAYAGIFGDHKPARAVVPTRDLHYGLKVEVSLIAVVD